MGQINANESVKQMDLKNRKWKCFQTYQIEKQDLVDV